MKKYKQIVVGLVLVGVLGVAGWVWQSRIVTGKDIKLGVISESGIGMVSVSRDRRMINSLKVEGEVEVWIPGGLGWYRSDRVARVLAEEGQMDKADQIFFYNFGFTPDKVLRVADFSDWNNDWQLWRQIGLWDYGRYLFGKSEMVLNEDSLVEQISDSTRLGQRWTRDFADSGLLADQMRVTVINTTEESGLASFVGSRLEWSGITVVGLLNDDKKVDGCLLVTGPKTEESLAFGVLSAYFQCSQGKDEYLRSENEAELYLGPKYAEMINYLSYVRSF